MRGSARATSTFAALIGICAGAGALADEPFFMGLGHFPGGDQYSYPYGLSDDGAVVAGYGNSMTGPEQEAFRWTESQGLLGLGFLPGHTYSYGYGVSGDGLTIVGQSSATGISEAFLWTEQGGIQGLGFLPGCSTCSSYAEAVSADGAVVVGSAKNAAGNWEPFRWTATGGMVGLGFISGDDNGGATDVSADGSTVVGWSEQPGEPAEPWRWTVSGGMIGLGDLGGTSWTRAHGVSADGTVVVGTASTAEGREAFRWTASEGMVSIGDLPGGLVDATARATSANGLIVVGHGQSNFGPKPFIWDPANGMRALQQVLEDSGLDLTGWSLQLARAVSADGLTFVGTATNPQGDIEAWIAHIPTLAPLDFTFTRVVDTNTQIPGSPEDFFTLGDPSLDSGNVAFWGMDFLGDSGIYLHSDGLLATVADSYTLIPGGTGTFDDFHSPSISGTSVALIGDGPDSQRGMYTYIGGTLGVVADRNMLVPSGGGYYDWFRDPSIENEAVTFHATGGDNAIYLCVGGNRTVVVGINTPIPGGSGNFALAPTDVALDHGDILLHGILEQGLYLLSGGVLDVVVDANTQVPGWLGSFQGFGWAFSNPVLDTGRVAFYGTGLYDQQGIYTTGGGLRVVADRNTPIPHGSWEFTNFFEDGLSMSNGAVVFLGEGYVGQLGIYIDIDGDLAKIVDLDDLLDGQAISFDGLSIGSEAIHGNQVAFSVRFVDGSEAIYKAKINCFRGDVTGDGLLNGLDAVAMVAVLLDPTAASVREFCAADMNLDGRLDGADIQVFVQTVCGL